MDNLFDELFGKRSRSVNSKVKGNRNELRLAKKLTEWTGHEFTRIPQSGGLRWKNLENICGDLISTNKDFDFPFVIETKHLKSFTSPRILAKNSAIYSIWRQVKDDSERYKAATDEIKHPLLFLRKNGMPIDTWYVVLSDEDFKPLPLDRAFNGKHIIGYLSNQIFSLDYTKFLEHLYGKA